MGRPVCPLGGFPLHSCGITARAEQYRDFIDLFRRKWRRLGDHLGYVSLELRRGELLSCCCYGNRITTARRDSESVTCVDGFTGHEKAPE